MSTIQAERVAGGERRQWHRVKVHLPVRLVDTEGCFEVVSGWTVDIGVGGLRAQVERPLSGSVEATVQIELASGCALLCEALVAGGGAVGEGWEYRLAFRNLEAGEIAALEHLVSHAD